MDLPFFELLPAAFAGLGAIALLALATWAVGTMRDNVGYADRVWSLFFVAAALVYASRLGLQGARTPWLMALVAVWALRLAAYITWRGWGAEEDRRYRDIRERNQPHFALKSLFIVFGLQAVLAWLVSAPLLAGMASRRPLTWLDGAGIALAVFGIVFEAVADRQMQRFQGDPARQGQVMDEGLWRWSRHPNYFGECCVWWGLFLIAAGAGGWWTVLSPLLMTLLLLKVSGVSLLEKDIGDRRPGYRDYVRSTNAFFPGPRRLQRAER